MTVSLRNKPSQEGIDGVTPSMQRPIEPLDRKTACEHEKSKLGST